MEIRLIEKNERKNERVESYKPFDCIKKFDKKDEHEFISRYSQSAYYFSW